MKTELDDKLLAELRAWMVSVIDTIQQAELDLLLYGNAFYVKGEYPTHWRRLDPTRAVARRVKVTKRPGLPRYKWVYSHPDAQNCEIAVERLVL